MLHAHIKCESELDIDQTFLFIEQSDKLCSNIVGYKLASFPGPKIYGVDKILGVDILGIEILRSCYSGS